MAGGQKDGLGEALWSGASAAHLARGAMKAGKAVSGAAKGTAMGGPYGAAAGALWEGHKAARKIVAVTAALLMLPVLFVLMLPSLVFGGLSAAFSPADPETPILNSGDAIAGNADAIDSAISGILEEGMEDVMGRIERDFAASGGDRMEIINPYEAGTAYNACLFVSQYCAAKEKEFAGISIEDMAATLRQGKSHLYSYRRTEEMREKVTEGPEDEEGAATSEKWMVYTVSYNGEDYFASQAFALTESQKKLAADYARNLSLFMGDGMVQDLEGWEGGGAPSLGSVRFTDGDTEVVYFSQLDERYAGKPYGTDHIGGYGCGPTAMAIVVSSLSNRTADPVQMAQWAYENGYWCKGSGSYHSLIPGAAKSWGLDVSGCPASEPQRILDALSDGKLVVALMSKGHFTSGGHFIVLRGVEDGKILVADPASYRRSQQSWDLSIILDEASRRARAGGPFWIIGRNASPYPAEREVLLHEQPE